MAKIIDAVRSMTLTHAAECTGGGEGGTGYTYTPHLTEDNGQVILSWTNDGGLENPEPINIKGADGAGGANSLTTDDAVTAADINNICSNAFTDL